VKPAARTVREFVGLTATAFTVSCAGRPARRLQVAPPSVDFQTPPPNAPA
jgi:hypothetical protein